MRPIWQLHYDPLGHWALSTLVAAAPVVVLFSAIALWRIRIHLAALAALAVAFAIALAVYHMPASAAVAAAIFGGAYGLFPLGWIILNLIFLYELIIRRFTNRPGGAGPGPPRPSCADRVFLRCVF